MRERLRRRQVAEVLRFAQHDKDAQDDKVFQFACRGPLRVRSLAAAQHDNLVGMTEIGEVQNGKARARRRFHADGVALRGELGVGFRAG